MGGVKQKRKRMDIPFMVSVVMTVLLAVAVIQGVRMEIAVTSTNPKIDVKKVQGLINRGQLSGREAEYWEEAPKK